MGYSSRVLSIRILTSHGVAGNIRYCELGVMNTRGCPAFKTITALATCLSSWMVSMLARNVLECSAIVASIHVTVVVGRVAGVIAIASGGLGLFLLLPLMLLLLLQPPIALLRRLGDRRWEDRL